MLQIQMPELYCIMSSKARICLLMCSQEEGIFVELGLDPSAKEDGHALPSPRPPHPQFGR